ncbi:ferritin [Candidatus Peregrinibacteria bacterium]|nr:ferritin [Candidatus Peregrinibacteria bacterium]
MGTKGNEIIDLDIDELIKKLNSALADEWLAYYQYWVGAKVVEGAMSGEAITELTEHADEELNHANLLADRIVQLGGTPVLNPAKWQEMNTCDYKEPNDPAVLAILDQNIEAEQCAIVTYQDLLNFTKDKDVVTYFIILEILKDEVEHEDDLQQLKIDIEKIRNQN